MAKHTHILVGILHRPDLLVTAPWAYGHKQLGMPLGTSYEYKPVFGTDVAAGRNEIVEYALSKGVEWLFFNDDDVVLDGNTLITLWNKKKDMTTAVYWSKQYPPDPLLFRGTELGGWDWGGPYLDWHAGDFIRIDAAGCGAVLINTKVFRAMEKPWFRTDYNSDWKMHTTFDQGVTEDLLFYKRAAELGFELWADTSLQLRHIDRNTGIWFHIPLDSMQAQQRQQVVEGTGTLVDMGCGEAMRAFPGFTVVRVDGREECKPDIVSPLHRVPIADNFADVVFSCHSLEHFGVGEVFDVAREWIRILKIGGKLHILTPNLEWAAKNVMEGIQHPLTMAVFNGGQSNEYDFHKNVFTPATLKALFMSLKLEQIDVHTEGDGFQIVGTAIKTKEY